MAVARFNPAVTDYANPAPAFKGSYSTATSSASCYSRKGVVLASDLTVLGSAQNQWGLLTQ
jgi:hypothetical protein